MVEQGILGHASPARWLPGGVLLVALGTVLFPSAGRDDAYISFWPARTLASTGEIVNYSGERIEQSSSLLHVLVLAAADVALPVSLPTIAWAVGVLGAVGAVVLAAAGAERAAPGAGSLAGLLTASSAYLVYWSTAGLETSLAALALVAAVVTLGWVWTDGRPAAWAAYVVAAVSQVLVRPEGALVLGAVLAGAAVATLGGRRLGVLSVDALSVRRWLGAVAVVAGAWISVAAFRTWYFDAIVPQPVSAKVGGLRIEEGFRYLRLWLVDRPAVGLGLVAAVVAAATLRRVARPEPLLAALAVTAVVGATATSGGDWMEAGRMLAPAAPCVGLLTAVGVHRLAQGRALAVATGAVLALNAFAVLHVARSDSTTGPLWSSVVGDGPTGAADGRPFVERLNRVHVRDAAFIPVLSSAIERVAPGIDGPVRIATGQAGMVPYYAIGPSEVAVELIDIGSLASDHFDACSDLLHRSALGNAISYADWFSDPDQCGVPLPHLVYGLGHPVIADIGPYVLVHRQQGTLRNSSDLLPGAAVEASLYLAVRADVLADIRSGGDR